MHGYWSNFGQLKGTTKYTKIHENNSEQRRRNHSSMFTANSPEGRSFKLLAPI